MTSPLPRIGAIAGLIAAFAAGSMLDHTPAAAQTTRNAEVIVYGTDPCPRSTDSEIVVCRRLPETQRFRIPPRFRPSAPRQSRNSWVNRSKALANQGARGPMNCTPVGPSGYTGCALQEINQAAQERAESEGNDTAPAK